MTEPYPALSIDKIKTNGGTQARAGINRQTVMQYRQIISEHAQANGGKEYATWPFADPLTVFYDGETYWLADGFHRLTACREQGKYTVDADIRQGTRRDAVLYAVGANATHGLQRTDEDKRRAVTTLLRDEEWGKWSDREISRQARVSHPFVAKVRRELQDAGELESITSERTYTTRHGTTAVMNTQNIGGNGAGEQPEKTLYERLEQHVLSWTASRYPEIAGYESSIDALKAIASRAVGWKVPFTSAKNMALDAGLDFDDSDLMNVIMGMLEKHGYSVSKEQHAAEPPLQPGDYVLVNTETRYLQPGRVTAIGPTATQWLVKIEENNGFTQLFFDNTQLIKATADAYHDRRTALGLEATPEPQPEAVVLPDPEPEKLYLKVWHLESWVNEWLNDIQGDDRQLSAMKSGRMDVTGLMMYIEENLLKDDGPRRHYRKRDIMQAINNVLEQIRQVERADTDPAADDTTADLASIPHPFAAETVSERIDLIIRMAEQIVAHSDDINVTLEMGTAVSHMYAALKAAKRTEPQEQS